MFTIKQNDADPGKLSGLVQSWLSQPEDVCIVTQDQQRIMTHRILLGCHSRLLLPCLLEELAGGELTSLSVPATGQAVRGLLRLLAWGVTAATSRAQLAQVEEAAHTLGVPLARRTVHCITVPESELLAYNRTPVNVQLQLIKPNTVDMTNPSLDDLDILDNEIAIVEYVDGVENGEREVLNTFPDTTGFSSTSFKNQLKTLTKLGSSVRRKRIFSRAEPEAEVTNCNNNNQESFPVAAPKLEPDDEFAPGPLLESDAAAGQAGERRGARRRLYLEPSSPPMELPGPSRPKQRRLDEVEVLESGRFYCASCECGLGVGATLVSPVQRELYNSCDDCVERKARSEIRKLKQKKYLQLLKNKKDKGSPMTGVKYDCKDCDYKASNPSNLKTHQMAKHNEENFIDEYVKEYFEKNRLLIL